MALLTVQNIKDDLRIENANEDGSIARWIAEAIAKIETFIWRPILSASVPVSEAPAYPYARSVRSDIDNISASSVVITTTALDTRADYATRIEPLLNSLLRDIVADHYFRRNPNATQETTTGVTIVYDNKSGLPQRALTFLRGLRPGV